MCPNEPERRVRTSHTENVALADRECETSRCVPREVLFFYDLTKQLIVLLRVPQICYVRYVRVSRLYVHVGPTGTY
jgi:hypothetical protein